MKTALFALSLALLGAPVAVLAQANPGQHDSDPRFQAMQQMRQLHQQARIAMLNSLSPASRNLLASVVGQLAISPNPDFDAAANRLDAALSPGEKTAILNAHQSLFTQMRTLHEQLRAQSGEAQEPAHQYVGSGAPGAMRMHAPLSAGHVLLMMAQPEMDRFFVARPKGLQ